jgi:hypothetical protein
MSLRGEMRQLARVGSVLLAVFLGWAAGGGAGERKGGGQAEDIKVHGHWTIDLRNPDGTLASHNEFENALSFDGNTLLTGLLSNHYSDPIWGIALFGSPQPCDAGGGVPTQCQILEPRHPSRPATWIVKNLAVNWPYTSGGPRFELTGSVTAAYDSGRLPGRRRGRPVRPRRAGGHAGPVRRFAAGGEW